MSYFPQWYFPGGATPAADPDDADDLLAAIRAFFEAQPSLAAIAGGIFTLEAGDRSDPPYCLVDEASAALDLKTSSSTVHDTRVRFKVYAGDLDEAGTLGDLVAAAFRGQPLSWPGGNASAFVPRGRKHVKEPGRGKGNERRWHLALEFQTRVKRAV